MVIFIIKPVSKRVKFFFFANAPDPECIPDKTKKPDCCPKEYAHCRNAILVDICTHRNECPSSYVAGNDCCDECSCSKLSSSDEVIIFFLLPGAPDANPYADKRISDNKNQIYPGEGHLSFRTFSL